MKKWIITFAAVAIFAAGIVYVKWPVGHIPTYDAHLVRLAETPLQGYCAGIVFWSTQGQGSGWQAADCRKHFAHNKKFKHYVSLSIAQKYFCKGIIKMGYDGGVGSCIGVLDSYSYGPTYTGGLTADWNQARPYPKKSGPSLGL